MFYPPFHVKEISNFFVIHVNDIMYIGTKILRMLFIQ